MILKNFKIKKEKHIKSDPDCVVKCPECENLIFIGDMDNINKVCPLCGNYFRMSARERIRSIIDENTFTEYFREKKIKDPLGFPGYIEKQGYMRDKTGEDEAVICGIAKIDSIRVVIAVMNPEFMMGSMGSTVGEKITKSVELAQKKKYPLIIFSASGGARMQEGMFSLMQMAKTSQAIAKFSSKGNLFISVMTHPTTGGVSASFANLGDVIIAEKNALIGFAGQRVIKQVTGTTLPEGFQRAEFLLQHGLVDMVVSREKMRRVLIDILTIHRNSVKRS